MSYSSLCTMDKDFNGYSIKDFDNSWLFAPIIWDILYHKYITYDDDEQTFMAASMFDGGLTWRRLNEKINNTNEQIDRIIWELSNQQVFFTKDKEFVAICLEKFYDVNKCFTGSITNEAIYKRVIEYAESIRSLDEGEYPYFIFKNTSCDDSVQRWFLGKYDEENCEYEAISLDKQIVHCTEFVIIEDSKITNFISNLDYFKKEEVK